MYESIVESTLKVLDCLPTPVPEHGGLAGMTREYIPPFQAMFQNDNYHFPMGTAYLRLGVPGVAHRAETAGADPLRQGIARVYRAVAAYFSRYADAVEAAACGEARLEHIAEMLRKLSQGAPTHFDEALQLTYLMWKLRCLNSCCGDIGRLDVHLRSWYEADIAAGYVTEDDVLALLCDFWKLLNRNNSGDTLINVMVGGKNPDGTDAGSRLSALMLEATKRTALTEPHINVRIHPGLREDVYRAMLEVQLMGHGQATVYNDEVIIPSLIRFGVPEELAYSYTNDGCTEIMLDGNSGIDFDHIDAVATFELAFYGGDWAPRTYREKVKYWNKNNAAHYYTPEAIPGYASGKAEDCRSFDEFYRLFLNQYAFQTRSKAAALRRLRDDRYAGSETSVLLSGTYDSVLETGKDLLSGGFRFDAYMMFSGSIPTVAESLAAVKEVVFERKLYTIPEIKEAIRVNFEGYEVMRRRLAAAPKFGNDDDTVDLLAADIAKHFCGFLEEYRAETGFAIMPALLGWRFLEEAYGVAATPDGRRYADPIAEHYCATPGKAVNGPTALIRSISKAKEAIAKACGVCAVQLSLPRNLGNNDAESLEILDSLISAAAQGQLNQMNIAIYDAELLRKAQADPENHRDLIVRVWGYCARFVDLCPQMQEHVIRRVTQTT